MAKLWIEFIKKFRNFLFNLLNLLFDKSHLLNQKLKLKFQTLKLKRNAERIFCKIRKLFEFCFCKKFFSNFLQKHIQLFGRDIFKIGRWTENTQNFFGGKRSFGIIAVTNKIGDYQRIAFIGFMRARIFVKLRQESIWMEFTTWTTKLFFTRKD